MDIGVDDGWIKRGERMDRGVDEWMGEWMDG